MRSIIDNSWPPIRKNVAFVTKTPQNLFRGLLKSLITIIIIIELATPHDSLLHHPQQRYYLLWTTPLANHQFKPIFRWALISTYCTLMYPLRPIEVELTKPRIFSFFSNRVGCSYIFGYGNLLPTFFSVYTNNICGGTTPKTYTVLPICILMIHLMRSTS